MIDVFDVALDLPALSALDRRLWLSPQEEERAGRFRIPELERRYVAAHVALRLVLGKVLDQHPSSLRFIHNPWGKPELKPGPSFNMSHAEARALIAVGCEAAIGVDIEAATHALDAQSMEGVLAPDEKRLSQAAAPSDLLRLWVRKEAVLKAYGRGVSHDPRRISVGFPPADFGDWRKADAADAPEMGRYHYIDLDVGQGHTAALARAGAPPPFLARVRALAL
jgi:4'-phosphopantetheinyl transferase